MARSPLCWSLVPLVLVLAGPAAAGIDDPQDPESLFFAGLDLKEAGDCEGAVSRFQLALQLDDTLHQARLYVAECYYLLGMKQPALDELRLYLAADVEAKRTDQAHELVRACGGDPVLMEKEIAAEKAAAAADAGSGDSGSPDTGYVPSTGDGGATGPAVKPAGPARWAPLTLEIGPLVEHYGNDIQLVAAGPVIGGRFLVWRYLELLAQWHVGFGPYPGEAGTIHLPAWAFGAAASIPAGPVRIVAGAEVPLAISRKGDEEAGVNTGILGVFGVRGVVPDTRLVFGGQFEGGYLVRPTIAGSLRVGLLIGPMTE